MDCSARTPEEHERLRHRTGIYDAPYRSLPAEQLADEGYVQAVNGETVYYAPDAEVLLSESFLDNHCFRTEVDEKEEPGLVGLSFEPTKRSPNPDIRGTLWLDPETAELRHLEYRYTNLGIGVDADASGGRIEFRRLPNGTWIVNR